MSARELALKICHVFEVKPEAIAMPFLESLLQAALAEAEKNALINSEANWKEHVKSERAAAYREGFNAGKVDSCCECNAELFNVRQKAFEECAKIAEDAVKEWNGRLHVIGGESASEAVIRALKSRAGELK